MEGARAKVGMLLVVLFAENATNGDDGEESEESGRSSTDFVMKDIDGFANVILD